MPGHRWFLLQQNHLGARYDRPAAFVAIDRACDQLEQSGLACTVAADQCQSVAWADKQVEMAEKPSRTLDEAEVFISKDGG
jgi:hypothetical protein